VPRLDDGLPLQHGELLLQLIAKRLVGMRI
jgi:hypothetical protein